MLPMRERPGHLLRMVLALCALGSSMVSTPARATDAYSEQSVKAAFIYRFTAYVEWPEDPKSQGPFTIAVLGDDGVAGSLQELVSGRTVRSRRVVVRRIASIRDARGVQVLYVGHDRRADLRGLLEDLAGTGVLVVTDDRSGLESGSAVNFLRADNRMRFEVSLPAAQRARLKVSSELLSVAARVQQ
jgi:hypothetical protein